MEEHDQQTNRQAFFLRLIDLAFSGAEMEWEELEKALPFPDDRMILRHIRLIHDLALTARHPADELPPPGRRRVRPTRDQRSAEHRSRDRPRSR